MVLKFLQLNLWTLARFCYSSFLLQPHLLNKYVKSKYLEGSLAGVAQWIECWPENRKVTGRRFYSWSGHMPGLQARSPFGGMRKAT